MRSFLFAALTAAALLLSSSARADECDDIVPAGQDPRMFVDLVKECRDQAVTASLADAIASGAEADRLRDERLARLEAARTATPASAPPPSTPAQQPAPSAQQQVVYVPQGPAFGQPILPGVAIGSMPPSGGSSRPGIHIYGGFVGAHRLPVSADWFVCATDGGMPIGIAGGVPIGVMAAGGRIVTQVCAPASAELNVFNLDVRREMGFALYRPSTSYVGVFDLYATLSCPGSSSGIRQQFADGCPIHY